MFDAADPKGETSADTDWSFKPVSIIKFETHDARVKELFTNEAGKPPTFGLHDVTPKKDFQFLASLKRAAEEMVIEPSADGNGIVVTLAVDGSDFGVDAIGHLSSMTHDIDHHHKRAEIDGYTQRGLTHTYQRTSLRSPSVRGKSEHLGQDVSTLINVPKYAHVVPTYPALEQES